MYDLSTPEFNPPECPEWVKEKLPEWVKPYVGINRLPAEWQEGDGKALAMGTKGIDRYQANQFVWHCAETAAYLYGEFTPTRARYVKGTLPGYEKVAAQYTAGCRTETEKAVALLTRALPAHVLHPIAPPRGPKVPTDRNLLDEALLASGSGWCNEQSRVFIRLCQVSGLQGRNVHLFGQNHSTAEFYADGRWVWADATYWFIARAADGRPLSAAECHDGGAGQRAYAKAKVARMQELMRLSDAELGFAKAQDAAQWREQTARMTVDEIATRRIGFGVVNYPLPKQVCGTV